MSSIIEIIENSRISDIGILPKDWLLPSYDEAFDFLTTATYSRAQLSMNDEINYVHYGDIHTKCLHFLDFNRIILPTIKNELRKNYPFLKDGDVIIVDASEDYEGVGKSVEVKNLKSRKAISGLHTFLLRNKNDSIAHGFKGYIHSNKLVKKQMDTLATGLKVYGVSKTNLKKILIPLPPTKEEQTAIATALNDTDELISFLDKLIAKKRMIKQGAMQELLKPKLGWVKKTLGEIAEIRDGTHQTPNYQDTGIPFYSVENVSANDFENTKFISHREHYNLTKNWKIEKGDILMTRIGSIGVCKYIDWDVNASFYVSLALLKIKKEYSAKFISHYSNCNYFKNEMEMNSLLFAYPKKINLGQISKVNIIIPLTIGEQNRIADILTDMVTEIEALEKKLEKYKMLKQGMIQNLLTGKIRLV